MLTVEQLEVRYGKSAVVHGIDLDVDHGQVAVLLGRNGAGRSTVLKAIMGLVPPADGRVVLDGEEVTGLPPYRVARHGIAYVPEERRVFANLTVEENLTLAGRRGVDGEWSPDAIYELFPVLRDRRRQRSATLSGGEQQMLAIARALAANPRIILLDEPLEGLAPSIAVLVEESIHELRRRGMTILLVDQNAEMALRVADRGYVIELGEIVMQGSGDELRGDAETVKRRLAV
jgi:branched-chain amino acid transport system ATP-binding protein